MEGKRRWLGWIAIGLGALALVVALLGRGFGSQFAAAVPPGAYAPQSSAQQGAGQQMGGTRGNLESQGGMSAPGAEARRGVGPQGAEAPGNVGPQGAEARRGPGRPGDAGFGLGGWLRFPLKLLGGVSQIAALALLGLLGLWLLRGRGTGGAPNSGRTEPAQTPQAPLSPTGESYTDESSDRE